jgi:sulfur-oxidizing protein SoxX
LLVSGFSLAAGADEYCHWEQNNASGMPAIAQPLCGLSGDVARGRATAIDRDQGNCLACHVMPIPEEDFHGQLGPPLHGVASRYSEGCLRLRLVDATLINPMTIMPGYYRHPDDNHRLAERLQGKTLLTAQQVEDLLAYLMTLK